MTYHHYKDNSPNELQLILDKVLKTKKYYMITISDKNLITELDTDYEELILYAKNNNPNLEESENNEITDLHTNDSKITTFLKSRGLIKN